MNNTPSPEAVEAAEKEIGRYEHVMQCGTPITEPRGHYVQQLLDTQTASLRKRVEELTEEIESVSRMLETFKTRRGSWQEVMYRRLQKTLAVSSLNPK